VLLQDMDSLEGCLLRILDVLLVVRIEASDWTIPATEFGKDLGVGEGEPFQDGGIVLFGLA
jgi:hypothetical protein